MAGIPITGTFIKGAGDTGQFAINTADSLKIPVQVVADITARNAFVEFLRMAYMLIYVVSDGNTYRLGSDVTISGQVWTLESGSYILTTARGAADGVAPLDSNSKIPSQYLSQVLVTKVHTAADLAAMYLLTTYEGDLIIVTDASADPLIVSGSATYVKLNDTAPSTTLPDFSIVEFAVSVTSVNGETGVVSIDFTDLLAWGSSSTQFAAAVAADATVTANAAAIATNITDITNLTSTKAAKTNVLELDNTSSFTPTGNYHPATKKYVDDEIGALSSGTPGGNTTEVQVNVTGAFAGFSTLTYASNLLTVDNVNLSATPTKDNTLTALLVRKGDGSIQYREVSSLPVTLAGSDTYVQFNDGGVFGADANLTFNKATDIFAVGGTKAIKVPVGTDAQRPTGVEGYIRLSSDDNEFEGYKGGRWMDIGWTTEEATTQVISPTIQLINETVSDNIISVIGGSLNGLLIQNTSTANAVEVSLFGLKSDLSESYGFRLDPDDIEGDGVMTWDQGSSTDAHGIQYVGDISATFVATSLINKGYADSTYATVAGDSYWAKTGTTTLTGAVTIEQNNNDFLIRSRAGAPPALQHGLQITSSGATLFSAAASPSGHYIEQNVSGVKIGTLQTSTDLGANGKIVVWDQVSRVLANMDDTNAPFWRLTGDFPLTGNVGITDTAQNGYTFSIWSDDGIEGSFLYIEPASISLQGWASGGTNEESLIQAATDSVTLQTKNDPAGTVRKGLVLSGGTAIFTDNEGSPTGLSYAADYGATFVARSLIDKGYADGSYLLNGALTTLTGATTIAQSTNLLEFTSSRSGVAGTKFTHTDGADTITVGTSPSGDDFLFRVQAVAAAGNNSSFRARPDNISLDAGNGANITTVYLDSSGSSYLAAAGTTTFKFTDSRTTTVGFEYGADYTADFGTRSLIDKGFADSAYWGLSTSSITTTADVTLNSVDGNILIGTDSTIAAATRIVTAKTGTAYSTSITAFATTAAAGNAVIAVQSETSDDQVLALFKITVGANNTWVHLNTDLTGIHIRDDINTAGMYYNADYATNGVSNHGDRWIADKGYNDATYGVAGATTQLQYNNAGAPGASASLTWTAGSSLLTIDGSITLIDASGGSSIIKIVDGANDWVEIGPSETGNAGALFLGDGTTNIAISSDTADACYINRSFSIGVNTAPSANTKLRLGGIPTATTGLSTGDVWANSGVLTIV